jgi:TrmH family RNA methyltransferase
MLGRSHPTIRRLRELRRERERRDAEGVLVAEGVHLAQAALASRARVEFAIVSPRLMSSSEGALLRRGLDEARVQVIETTDRVLDSIQDAQSPQPIMLVVVRSPVTLEEVLSPERGPQLVVVACDLQDPGNLGSMLRTADAAGATGGVILGDGVDPFHPRAVRASMGSVFRMPMVRATDREAVSACRELGIRLLGTATDSGSFYDSADLTIPVAVLFGREGSGLADERLAEMDAIVRVPMRSGVESLSVGAAAAVILFEAQRQRGRPGLNGE